MRRIVFNRKSWSMSQKGDTIVEVLIAVGIVSLVLTSAYALTNRNVQGSQNIQEQGQAQKMVERQIELLRSHRDTAPDLCYDENGVSQTLTPDCRFTSSGVTAPVGFTGLVYQVAITPDGSAYRVSASWETLGGNMADVTMYYKK